MSVSYNDLMKGVLVTVTECPAKKDHICDTNGPFVYGMRNGTVIDNEERARKEGCLWGSVTCSVCGSSAMLDDQLRT